MTNLVYGAAETRAKISEIQNYVKYGFIPKLMNKNTHDTSYILNQKILDSLLKNIATNCQIEYDKELNYYTAYNSTLPQIYGEGNSKKVAMSQMLAEAKTFAKDYADNIELFSNVLDGFQQFLIGNILLNIDDDQKIKEILKIG